MANKSPDPGTTPAASDQPVEPDQLTQPVPVTDAAVAAAIEAPTGSDAESAESRCPWCSAGLALGAGLASCPNCGAHLSDGDDAAMPGLTQVVPGVMKKTVSAEPVRRSRLLAWISGEMIDEPDESEAVTQALAPPSRDVRREILRIELESAGIPIPPGLLADADEAPEAPPAEAEAGQESSAA